MRARNEIDTLEAVHVGGVTQWIRVRGMSATNPALLLMQQGPGLPIINESRRCWNCWATGSAARPSWPASPSAPPSRRWPRRAARTWWRHWWQPEWTSISPPPRTTPTISSFAPPERRPTDARWAANFGGVTANAEFSGLLRGLLASLLSSPDYSVVDVIRAIRGIATTQAALLPELATTNLVDSVTHLDVPIVIVQGRLDQVAPEKPARRFFDAVSAPSKQLVWFENSAHTPQYDEPEKFRELLMGVRTAYLADN